MYRKKAHIHFVGIGGIGMSGIASIVRHQGYTISGCDLDLTQKSVQQLQALGCPISQGNNTPACHDPSIDVLVYSSAVQTSNPEILAAQQRGIPTIPRALMLAELMRTKYSVAIAGSHGKTTTTSMISHMLIQANMDPTVVVGGHVKNISSNAQLGEGEFLVAETDESDRSFLYLYPTIAVITNIDLEHLDTYKDFDDIKETFKRFLDNLPFYGKAIVCIDDPGIQSILPIPHIKTIKYSAQQQADVWATNIVLEADHSTFMAWHHNTCLGTITLSMPGMHNLQNALAAVAVGIDLELPFTTIAAALQNFKGIERRFSFHGTTDKGAEVFDDYGHHPNEILNTLKVARRRAKQKLRVLFQPHRYSRTEKLWDQFLQTFIDNPVDDLVITDIYPASEAPIQGVTAERFVQALKIKAPDYPVRYVPFEKDLKPFVEDITLHAESDDLVLLLGAGKMNLVAPQVMARKTE